MTPPADPRAWWRAQLRLLSTILAIWFAVGFVPTILLVEPLNRIRVGGFPLGFWFAQQGAIYVFVILVWVYAWAADRLARRFHVD